MIGSGAAKRVSAVRWGVAGNIVVAWVLTLPARQRSIGALTYGVTRIFGTGAAGPIVVSALILVGGGVVFARRLAAGPADHGRGGRAVTLVAAIIDGHDLRAGGLGVTSLAGIGVTAVFACRDPRRRHARGRPAPRWRRPRWASAPWRSGLRRAVVVGAWSWASSS